MAEQQGFFSIGALSRASGVPAETLRTWERRYGFPSAERTESGHRRYPPSTLDRLRLVMSALALGHRPSNVLGADEATLRQWLAVADVPGEGDARSTASSHGTAALRAGALVERWLEHVERYEGRALDRELRRSYSALGADAFLELGMGPFLNEVGLRWERGKLGVRHEHFASERVREFLSSQWRPLSDAAPGPTYVLATLPNEHHVLGLYLVALVVALSGARVVMLGANTPASEIAGAVEHHAASGVLISIAPGADAEAARAALRELSALIPTDVPIVVGGGGMKQEAPGTLWLQSLPELREWLVDHAHT